MEELLIEILKNEFFRSFVEGLVVKIVVEVLHRRATDPKFLAESDAAWSQFMASQTDEEKQNAMLRLQSLMSSG